MTALRSLGGSKGEPIDPMYLYPFPEGMEEENAKLASSTKKILKRLYASGEMGTTFLSAIAPLFEDFLGE